MVKLEQFGRLDELDTKLSEVTSVYLETLSLIERLHRLLLDVLKDSFERSEWTDLNSVQALMLFNIGDEEVSAGELKSRGYYQGSNVSYNLKKLVDLGYLHHERSNVDRRSVRIRLTDKGVAVRRFVAEIFERQSERLLSEHMGGAMDLAEVNMSLERLEAFWRGQIRYIY